MTLDHIVTKLNMINKSAGNSLIFKDLTGTSETVRNKVGKTNPTKNSSVSCYAALNVMRSSIQTEKVKKVSIHVPKHLKPLNDVQFGHYLAGLIDGDGHFSSGATKQQLVIVFNSADVQLAYFIKNQLGFGTIHKVKSKNASILVVASVKGLEKVLNLINGKLRSPLLLLRSSSSSSKLNQINNNVLTHSRFIEYGKGLVLTLNSSSDLNNHWLAGFSDADASFQIKLVNRNNKTEVRLNYQVDQKKDYLLILIQNFIGGNIGYRSSQDTYYYGSTSFGSAKNVINYFDKYHLLSSKHVNYLKWRKAYLLVQDKKHLTSEGVEKITKLKNTMNRYCEAVDLPDLR